MKSWTPHFMACGCMKISNGILDIWRQFSQGYWANFGKLCFVRNVIL